LCVAASPSRFTNERAATVSDSVEIFGHSQHKKGSVHLSHLAPLPSQRNSSPLCLGTLLLQPHSDAFLYFGASLGWAFVARSSTSGLMRVMTAESSRLDL
jgi:hypothetical protein